MNIHMSFGDFMEALRIVAKEYGWSPEAVASISAEDLLRRWHEPPACFRGRSSAWVTGRQRSEEKRSMGHKSPRQRLLELAGAGALRSALMHANGPMNDMGVVDLVVAICLRYCEPRCRRARRAR